MCQLRNLLKVRNIIPRVANAFDVDGFRLVVDGRRQVFRSIALDEFGRNTQARQSNLQLVVGTAVQIAR
jgi:hypothetical protein